jgi:hypothetical protein
MSRNEKSFFKRNYSGNPGDKLNLHLLLFDAINTQKKYNETTLMRGLAPRISSKNIAFQKHYLQTQLLNCLVEYENRNNAEQRIYKDIQLIRIKRKRGLLDEALPLWEKTMNKAREAELFSMSQLLKREFEKMILFSHAQISYDDLHTSFASNIMTYDAYAEMITLRDIYTKTLLLKRKAHFGFDDQLEKEIRELYKKIEHKKKGLQSRSFWYRHYTRMTHATLLYLLQDIPASLAFIKEAVKDWWQHEKFIRTDTEHYIELMNMLNYTGILQRSFDYVEFVFGHAINEIITEEVNRANFEAVKYLALNKVYNKTARFNDVAALISSMKIKYAGWEPMLNADMNRTLCISLGIACLVLDKFDEALQYCRRGVTYFRDGTREDQISTAQLLLLLIVYNLDNPKLFDAQYKSTCIYFSKRGKTYPFEKALTNCLNEAFYLSSYKEKVAVFQKALDILDEHKENEVQKRVLNIFNFHGWLESKIKRMPYKEYVQKRYALETSDNKIPSPGF